MTRIGLVGYGSGGRLFHAPYIQAADGVELVGVVTRSPARREQLAADAPGVPAFDTLTDLLRTGVDAVTITTPPETRRNLVLEAIGAGVAVVADKPWAPTAAEGRELAAAAEQAGTLLTVYQNRRWDADIQTLRALINSGDLGEVQRFSSRMDLNEPGSLETGPAHGLLRDLGSHLIDQALWLFGPAARVSAHLDLTEVDGVSVDSGFVVSLWHRSGVHSTLSASKINSLDARELVLHARGGSYEARSGDIQTARLLSGVRPASSPDTWGFDTEDNWGTAHTPTRSWTVPSEQGSYARFYEELGTSVRRGTGSPVPIAEALHTLEVLDAARTSASEGVTVTLA